MRIGIIGGSGYTGVELLRLLSGREDVEVVFISSRAEEGKLVSDIFPNLRGHIHLRFSDPDQILNTECDLVFFATPNGTAMRQASALLDKGSRVVDLSADFRLKDVDVWQHWYGMTHTSPELVAEAVYGLPEMFRDDIRQARLVANPGCYPTAVQLGFLPLIEAGVVDTNSPFTRNRTGSGLCCKR